MTRKEYALLLRCIEEHAKFWHELTAKQQEAATQIFSGFQMDQHVYHISLSGTPLSRRRLNDRSDENFEEESDPVPEPAPAPDPEPKPKPQVDFVEFGERGRKKFQAGQQLTLF